MSYGLIACICVFYIFLLCGILAIVTTPNDEPHYRWKLYCKFYMSHYPYKKYFRTRFGAKWYYRKWKKECKWIYINRLKG